MYLVSLSDKNNYYYIINFASKKSKRLVRSIMGAELYAFKDAFDVSFTLAKDLSMEFGEKVSLQCFRTYNNYSMSSHVERVPPNSVWKMMLPRLGKHIDVSTLIESNLCVVIIILLTV